LTFLFFNSILKLIKEENHRLREYIQNEENL